jgi:hypothetical protein
MSRKIDSLIFCFVFLFGSTASAMLISGVSATRGEDPVIEPVLIHFEDFYFPGADIRVSYINYDNSSCIAGVNFELENHLIDSFDWDFYVKGTGFEHREPYAWHAAFRISGPTLEEGMLPGEINRYQRSELTSYGLDIGTYTWINFLLDENMYSVTAKFVGSPASIIATNFFFDDEGDHWSGQYLIDGVIVPEPATIAFLGFGGLVLLRGSKRKEM